MRSLTPKWCRTAGTLLALGECFGYCRHERCRRNKSRHSTYINIYVRACPRQCDLDAASPTAYTTHLRTDNTLGVCVLFALKDKKHSFSTYLHGICTDRQNGSVFFALKEKRARKRLEKKVIIYTYICIWCVMIHQWTRP